MQGSEAYFIDTVADYIEENCLSETEKGFNQTILYGKDTDFKTVVDNARRYPMMAQRQLVMLKEAQDMKDITALQSYIEQPSPTTVFVITYKHKKLNLNTKFGKLLKKNTVLLEQKKLYDNQIADWIVKYLKGKKFQITPKAAELTAEYLGTDLGKIVNELEKLTINIPQGTKITDVHIENNIGISREYNSFELQKALASRDALKANRIINYFVANPKKGPLVVVTSAIYGFFSKVYMYHFVKNESDNAILKALGLRSNWFLGQYKQAAAKYPLPKAQRVISILKEYDLRSKGVQLSESTADKELGDQTPHEELMKEMVWKILNC